MTPFLSFSHPFCHDFATEISIVSLDFQFTLKKRLPSLHGWRGFAILGGLMSYDVNRTVMWHRAAVYVDKILKGANPATLPVEPPQLELVINLKIARNLGATIPPEILASEVVPQLTTKA